MFYDQLKKACKANNTTVTALIKELGMSTGNGTSWKNGGVPSIEVLKKMAKRLKVTTDYLLEMDEDSTSDEGEL